jgi:maleate isomerase
METEIPAMLLARQAVEPERFTFHSSRMRMKTVSKEELAAMDAESGRCALELSDARVDVLNYACLVGIMSMGHGYHRVAEERMRRITAENGGAAPVITSAGALVHGLQTLGARKIAMIAPYVRSLTALVREYIENEGFQVLDAISLEIPDNLAVGARDPLALVDISKDLKYAGADAIVLSSCVQMPSLAAVPVVEERCGLPVVSAATCTVFHALETLGLKTLVPNAGRLLSGRYGRTTSPVPPKSATEPLAICAAPPAR